MGEAKQTVIGITLAAAIIAAWAALHLYAIFALQLGPATLWAIIPLMAVQTWLGAGLFIVAHDAMHGSLSPGAPAVNRWIGRAALGLYAFFPYDRLASKHHEHHRHPGGADDPDFYAAQPRGFWRWYAHFFATYFGLKQFIAIFAVVLFYALVLHASVLNILLFWAAPSIASSLQLFTFGTWLPHRRHDAPFADQHNARTLEYGWLASLFACYHFGYHLEHHRSPGSPWWRLPEVRRDGRAAV